LGHRSIVTSGIYLRQEGFDVAEGMYEMQMNKKINE